MLQAGYSRQDITPDFSVPLGGYGNSSSRMSQGWASRLYATCIALTDAQDQTVLLFSTDMIRAQGYLVEAARKSIEEATGIPEDHIMIAATHTHSSPDAVNTKEPSIPRFAELYAKQLTAAAVEALADRSLAQVQTARTEATGLGFVRHYITDEGEIIGDNFGDPKGKTFVAHTIPADEQMQLIRLVRQDKKDILLVNWQAHATLASTSATESGRLLRKFLCADYIGACRDHVEANTDVAFAFFLGGAGNLNSRSRIKEETPTTDYRKYGQQLGDFVLKAMADLTDAKDGPVRTLRKIYTGALDHSEDPRIDDAREAYEFWLKTNDRVKSVALAREKGFHSQYHAGAVVTRFNAEKTLSMELNTVTVGGIGFVCAPYEMFCDSCRSIKEKSPVDMTFVVSCCNNHWAYIPSKAAFDHGCYEVDNRKFPKGAAEELVDIFTDMLTQIK